MALLGPCAQTLISTLRFKQTSLYGDFCLHHCDRAHKEPLLPLAATFSTYNNIGPQACSNSCIPPALPKEIPNELRFLILINHPAPNPQV